MKMHKYALRVTTDGVPILPDDASAQTRILVIEFDSPVESKSVLAGANAMSAALAMDCRVYTFQDGLKLSYDSTGLKIGEVE